MCTAHALVPSSGQPVSIPFSRHYTILSNVCRFTRIVKSWFQISKLKRQCRPTNLKEIKDVNIKRKENKSRLED